MPDEHGNETREEAEERIATVRATQIFGDTPTDPTIGDTVAVAHDEEGANVAAAKVDAAAEEGDDEAADLSPEEAKRQNEALDAEEVDEAAEDDSDDDSTDLFSSDDDDDSDSGDVTAAEKVRQIEAADSPEEVDRLAEGDDRKTVQKAAEKKRSSWG